MIVVNLLLCMSCYLLFLVCCCWLLSVWLLAFLTELPVYIYTIDNTEWACKKQKTL